MGKGKTNENERGKEAGKGKEAKRGAVKSTGERMQEQEKETIKMTMFSIFLLSRNPMKRPTKS